MGVRRGITGGALALSFLVALTVSANAQVPAHGPWQWLNAVADQARTRVLASMHAPGAAPGAVIASPSRDNPNYFFHWVRDSGLTMLVLDPARDQAQFWDYARFSRQNQITWTLSGMGEPKYEVTGAAYTGPWGRPQNDGPALRAVALMKLTHSLLNRGASPGSQNILELYDGRIPTESVIKADLEYVSHHWREPGFDLWEEVKGIHFYTLMVSRRSMMEGADLAKRLGDFGAADWYLAQARAMEVEIEKFWDPERELVRVTLNLQAGLRTKRSELDIAVVLAALHGGMGDGFFDWKDERILKTAKKLEKVFAGLYPVNQGKRGVLMGRYPEDVFSGNGFDGGNPWILATLAMAELHVLRGEIDQAEPFLDRVREVTLQPGQREDDLGPFNEEVDAVTGKLVGAIDLTWNSAALLTLHEATSCARNFAR